MTLLLPFQWKLVGQPGCLDDIFQTHDGYLQVRFKHLSKYFGALSYAVYFEVSSYGMMKLD
ncbi:MAG: hypothetical protein ACW985_11265 [Candidatus Thorarchaeota archaeon]